MRVERSFRGISVRLALSYLESLGGEIQGENRAEGNGWTAELSAAMVEIGPSLELTEITVVFEGEETRLDELIPKFEQKAVRAGG